MNKDVLGLISGVAGLLVIIGLFLVLLGPVVVWNRQASYQGLQAQISNLSELKQLELSDIMKTQKKEQEALEKQESEQKEKDDKVLEDLNRQNSSLGVTPAPGAPDPSEEIRKKREEIDAAATKRREERSKKQEKWAKEVDDKKAELDKNFDEETLKRQLLNEQVTLRGSKIDIWLVFLGKLLMIVGLLALTLQSDGLKQKVLLAILLLTMLTLLGGPGVSLRANLGGGDYSEYSRTTGK